MKVEFRTKKLERLETDLDYLGGWPEGVVRKFRTRLNFIRQAMDERDLRNMKSMRFEKLKGERSHQHSMRLNDQWRLLLEMVEGDPDKVVRVVDIEDYH
ncbi:MAG: type II toxin-antitoxin system RelE/ParE family toxin [Candidatus Thermoplasmatota archaeon]|nr:type II toxin-antitoxin system RelE/ParE family toxin [Candidatus Thermoplasmatota archaeon]